MKKHIIGYLKALGKVILGAFAFIWLLAATVTSLSAGEAFPWYVSLTLLLPIPFLMAWGIKKEQDNKLKTQKLKNS